MKNAKNNNANLYFNFSTRFLKSYFSTGGGMALFRIAYGYDTIETVTNYYNIYSITIYLFYLLRLYSTSVELIKIMISIYMVFTNTIFMVHAFSARHQKLPKHEPPQTI